MIMSGGRSWWAHPVVCGKSVFEKRRIENKVPVVVSAQDIRTPIEMARCVRIVERYLLSLMPFWTALSTTDHSDGAH